MDINIRKAVIDNLAASTPNSIKEIIDDATQSQTDTILPGLGVMFEVLWKNSPGPEKDNIVSKISSYLKH